MNDVWQGLPRAIRLVGWPKLVIFFFFFFCSFKQSLLSATFRKGSSEYLVNKSPVCVLYHIDCVTLEPDPFFTAELL